MLSSALVAVGSLGWALCWPYAGESHSSSDGPPSKVHLVQKRPVAALRSDFTSLQDRRLQGKAASIPVVNVVPKSEPVKIPPPATSFKLLGTMIEGDRSLALVSNSAGKSSFKGIGESIGTGNETAEVVEIRSESVVLRISGQLHTVRLERAKKG
jgi:hypothetical protein